MKLGLYLHFPFCLSKCPYCDFNSYQLKEDNQITSYISALYQEISAYSQKLKKNNITTIYLGGGTPTILSGIQIYSILKFCRDKFNIDKNAEITIEANPGTLDSEKLKLIIESGIDRLSLGAQSFNNVFLKILGRIHNTKSIIDSYFLAREIGFSNINIDIMFALPGQTSEDLQATLKKAISLKPDHLSLYNLTVKPGTEYYKKYKKGKLKLPNEDEEFEMYNWAMHFLKENNFEHYEIANFARPNKKSMHNLLYWQNKPYLGIGAGAFSFIRGYRYMNYENPVSYIKEIMKGKLPIDNGEKISLRKRMIETIILGLRTKDGVGYKQFKTRFGVSLSDIFSETIDKLVNLGLLQKGNYRIKLTKKGIFLANTVFREFVD